jgi:hypothetical protein
LKEFKGFLRKFDVEETSFIHSEAAFFLQDSMIQKKRAKEKNSKLKEW